MDYTVYLNQTEHICLSQKRQYFCDRGFRHTPHPKQPKVAADMELHKI